MRFPRLIAPYVGLLPGLVLAGCPLTDDGEPALPQGNWLATGPAADASVALDPTTADGGTPRSANGLPCDVAAVIADHCLSCHGTDLAAPMKLLGYADFARAAVTDPSRSVDKLVATRIHDTQRPMPPVSAQDTLSAAELATLDAWLNASAPQSSDSCAPNTGNPDAGAPAIDLSECDVLEEFRAHALTDPTGKAPYQPPSEQDHYQCFDFPVPWDGDVHGLRFDPLIGDRRIVHHWVLFATKEGAAKNENGCGTGRQYLSVWAPGPGGVGMPADVGLQMPKKGTNLQLEVHYNNTKSYPGVEDNSGVRVCATHTLRKNTAALQWLGSLAIALGPGQSVVQDTCTVNSGMGPVNVIASWPHMHKLGVHMKTELLRADGTRQIVVDAPFDFRDQGEHRVSLIVNQGDRLQTSCTFNNNTNKLVLYGENGDDEMCLNFLTAYPANGLSASSLTPGQCMGGLL